MEEGPVSRRDNRSSHCSCFFPLVSDSVNHWTTESVGFIVWVYTIGTINIIFNLAVLPVLPLRLHKPHLTLL